MLKKLVFTQECFDLYLILFKKNTKKYKLNMINDRMNLYKSNIWENINEKFKYAHMIFIDENEASHVINKKKT